MTWCYPIDRLHSPPNQGHAYVTTVFMSSNFQVSATKEHLIFLCSVQFSDFVWRINLSYLFVFNKHGCLWLFWWRQLYRLREWEQMRCFRCANEKRHLTHFPSRHGGRILVVSIKYSGIAWNIVRFHSMIYFQMFGHSCMLCSNT